MADDLMRDKLDFSIYCSEHKNNKLKISIDSSTVGASSGYEANIKIIVYPCDFCKRQSDKIIEAVDTLLNIKK